MKSAFLPLLGSLLIVTRVAADPCLQVACPTNAVVAGGTAWDFGAPIILTNCCAGDATITMLTTTTNGVCPRIFTRIWEITNLCADTLTCTQSVTLVDTTPPVLTCASNKTVQCSQCNSGSGQAGFEVLKSFTGNDGRTPFGELISGSDGALYGTTGFGGSGGYGTIFKVSRDGGSNFTVHTVLKDFKLGDGANPFAGLVAGGDGAFYGTTYDGGGGYGTIYKLSQDGGGNYTVHTPLKNLAGSDGAHPFAGLLEGGDGALYGTTYDGGSSNLGTVFKLSRDGGSNYTVHTVLKNFTGSEGAFPIGTLLEGSDGALYGTTFGGGSSNLGTVFKLSQDGGSNYTTHTILKSFTGGDGAYPFAGLLEGSDGAIYGRTQAGGTSNLGTVYKLSRVGGGNFTNHTVQKNFTGNDGAYPVGRLLEGRDGALYGTTQGGGADNLGTIYRLNRDGGGNFTLHTVLKSFNFTDGANPFAGLLEGGDGALYGTTQSGGIGFGVMFRVGCPSGWQFDSPAVTDNSGGPNVSLVVLSTVTNGTCPQLITRTWLATDPCGNTNSCSQTVTVVDSTPPVIICSSNKSVGCGANWSFDTPTASDNCSGTNVVITLLDTVTNQLDPRLITRTWLATDLCGNTNSCSQTVSVESAMPVLTCATNKTVNSGASWSFDPPTVSDGCGGTNVTITVFNTTTNGVCPLVVARTWQAVDASSNASTCTQVVTVVDTTPPVITVCPTNLVVCATNGCGLMPAVTNLVQATDDSGVFHISQSIAEGTLLCSNTLVTLTVTDACGNQASCLAPVTVGSSGALITGYALAPDGFHIQFATQPGFNYVVEFTDTLAPANWQPLTTILGNGNPHEVVDPQPLVSARFFRLHRLCP